MRVHILGSRQWRPIVVLAEASVVPDVARLARSVLRSMHDQHVGITPRLAVALAELMQPKVSKPTGSERADVVTNVWVQVVRRLGRELTVDMTSRPATTLKSRRPEGEAVLAVKTLPSWFVVQFATSLVQRACERADRCYLFAAYAGDASTESAVELAATYCEYDATIEEHLLATLSDSSLPAAYWYGQAVVARDLSRRAVMTAATTGAGSFPAGDSQLLSLLLRLRPKREGSRRQRDAVARHASAAGRRFGVRPPQGGVVGLRLTRRLEDVHEIAPSELALPRPLLLERLAGGGYNARHRPPPREPRRDLLVIGIAAAPTREWSVRLAKASWLHTLAELTKDLIRSGRTHSDFVWIEADRLGGLIVAHARIDALELGSPELLDPATFLRALGWLPAFIERGASYHRDLPELCDDDPATVSSWVRAAIELAVSRTIDKRSDGLAAISRHLYDQVHVCGMASADAGVDGTGRQRVMSALRFDVGGARARAQRRASIIARPSVIWLPASPDDVSGWLASSDGGPPAGLADSANAATASVSSATADMIAGSLMRFWLQRLRTADVGAGRSSPARPLAQRMHRREVERIL